MKSAGRSTVVKRPGGAKYGGLTPRQPADIPRFQTWFGRKYPSLKLTSLSPQAYSRVVDRFSREQNPDVKARKREYQSRPDVKARMREYQSRQDVKARLREYQT